jgi:hypothetical protein
MSDAKDDQPLALTMAESFAEAVEANKPCIALHTDEFTSLRVSPEGAIALEFLAGKMGPLEVLGRLEMAPRAAQALKAWLLTIESIPGTPPLPRDPQSTN